MVVQGQWWWRVTCVVLIGLAFSLLPARREADAGWTHNVGCGNGCKDGHNFTACVCKEDLSDCMEVECCNYPFVYLSADNFDEVDWSCGGGGVGIHSECPCGHLTSYYSDDWDQGQCGPCGTRQWQTCVLNGTITIQGNPPCHNWVDVGWCRSETGGLDACTPEGQQGGTISACQVE